MWLTDIDDWIKGLRSMPEDLAAGDGEGRGKHRDEVERIYIVYIHAGELGGWLILAHLCCEEELAFQQEVPGWEILW
jgi:hypothetical protein